eukprot:TRINITY_DN812_c0_g1_i3.p1 TRINITY_DN812_c0_g1~~TRINITY_DN812_c0_g1_i3.p1  ORF type:complete len:103 (-),score=57.23 TRINITY_DN812_c0_g1_i3:336-644(-)
MNEYSPTDHLLQPPTSPSEAAAALLGYRSEEDVAAYERAMTYFAHFDKNGDGVVDRKEFESLHRDLVKNDITKLGYEEAWTEIDADGDGEITRNEYVDFLIA